MRNEFQFIDEVRATYQLTEVGDDCAVLPKDDATDLLVTTDLLVQDVDFRLGWTTPEFLGHKALAVSLSDIAAMGGRATSALLSIAVPERLWKTDFLDRFYVGWQTLSAKHGVFLVGGDISRSPERLVIDSILLGDVPKGKAVRRSGAKAGDAVFVTGFLGAAAAGLAMLESGETLLPDRTPPARHLLLRHLQPLPQVETGNLLREYGLPSAMIDISDGLSSDLSHLLRASGVGARLDAGTIPVDPALLRFEQFADRALDLALNGGEDFELLFTAPTDKIPLAVDLGFYRIGEVTDRSGDIEIDANGSFARLEPRGYRHF